MNKFIALSLAVVSVASVGMAQAHKTMKPPVAKTPTEIGCAVMSKNKVNIAKATKSHMYADYKGHRYFFCCAGCPEAFKKNPAKYAKAPSIPTPKKAK